MMASVACARYRSYSRLRREHKERGTASLQLHVEGVVGSAVQDQDRRRAARRSLRLDGEQRVRVAREESSAGPDEQVLADVGVHARVGRGRRGHVQGEQPREILSVAANLQWTAR